MNHEEFKIKFIKIIVIEVCISKINPIDIGFLIKLIVVEIIIMILMSKNFISTNSLLKFNFWDFKMYILYFVDVYKKYI